MRDNLLLFWYRATATMESERAAFEAEKKAHYELYERQQQVKIDVHHRSGLI